MLVNAHDPSMPSMLFENIGEIQNLLQFISGGTVLDVGANVGSHTINFARKAGWVYSFEPHPHTYMNLCANILLHELNNVTPLNMALGSYNGETLIGDYDIASEHYSMGGFVGYGTLKTPMRTIDSLVYSQLSFIKIDTEGHEFEVLKGANVTLQRESPIVFVEVHSKELIEPIHGFMRERGYTGKEYISYIMHDKQGQDVPLTYGQLFWKEGRIVWAE